MPAIERHIARAKRRAEKLLLELGEEFRHARARLGLSQQSVADAAVISRSVYSRIERGKLPSVSVGAACRVGAVLGVDVSVKGYPGRPLIRDAAHARGVQKVMGWIGRPLVARTEVPLPSSPDRFELRSWDLLARSEPARRTAFEFETRLYDAQAQLRRWKLKLRDDPVDSLVIVVAATHANRRVLHEFGEVLSADFSRLRTQAVLDALRAGRHPPTGLILVEMARPRKCGR